MGNEKQGLGTRDEGLPSAGACQHHSLNLSCDSKRPTNLEKEFFFRQNNAGMSMKTKDRCGKTGGEAGMLLKTQTVTR